MGNIVSLDSMAPPPVVAVKEVKSIAASKPKVVTLNTNVHPVGTPSVILARTPRLATPGQDTFRLPSINSVACYSTAHGLSSISTQSVFEDSKGNVWIATRGSGVDKFDHKSFTNYSSAKGLIYDLISGIIEDKNGNLWFGTYGGIFKFDGKSFTRYNAQQGLTNESVSCILADRKNNIWAGTYGGGVFKFDGSSITNYSTRHGLSSKNVLSIYEARRGRIWIGTYETGVDMFDGKTFVNYTDEDGLNNNRVGSIREDSIGNIWLLTINGLWKMQLPGNEPGQESQNINSAKPLFKKYLFLDGFWGVGSDFNTLLYDNDGKMWAGASDHLTAFHSEREIPDSIQPNIQLTGISLYNQYINWLSLQNKQDTALLLGNGITLHDFKFNGLSKWYFIPGDLSLGSDNNYLSFQFVGIAIRRTQHIKYKYLLDGLDKNWSTISNKTEAVYNNLPPGKYTFKVKAVNSEGYWSNEYSYPFIIRTSWWQTLWFRIAAFFCLIIAFYGLIRWRLHEKFRFHLDRSEKEKRLAELQQKTSDLEMQALRAQMNPHFIFNSLNSINRFILQNNKAQASQYLTKFSRLVRLILQNSQAALITLESELESLKLYLELEAVRFDHHFEFKIIVDDDLDTDIIKVPPLIIQPYSENSIWHGLMHKEEKGNLEIKLYQQDDSLYCKITDDGIGRKKAAEFKSKSASATKPMSMQITASRIEMLQQKKQSDESIKITDLVLADGSAGGTEVIIKIPLIYS